MIMIALNGYVSVNILYVALNDKHLRLRMGGNGDATLVTGELGDLVKETCNTTVKGA